MWLIIDTGPQPCVVDLADKFWNFPKEKDNNTDYNLFESPFKLFEWIFWPKKSPIIIFKVMILTF